MNTLYTKTPKATEFSLSEFIGNRSAYADIMRARKEKATLQEAASQNLSNTQH